MWTTLDELLLAHFASEWVDETTPEFLLDESIFEAGGNYGDAEYTIMFRGQGEESWGVFSKGHQGRNHDDAIRRYFEHTCDHSAGGRYLVTGPSENSEGWKWGGDFMIAAVEYMIHSKPAEYPIGQRGGGLDFWLRRMNADVYPHLGAYTEIR